jgi:hypothetical protein
MRFEIGDMVEAAGVRASGTEPMQVPVDIRAQQDALRPLAERLATKRANVGSLIGAEGAVADAVARLVSGPGHIPLLDLDQALSALKRAARADIPELRTGAQGIAAKAVRELEGALEAKARAAGIWDDLSAGRQATILKMRAGDVLKRLRQEPVGTFRQMISAGDAGIELLREVVALAPQSGRRLGRAYLDAMVEQATVAGGFTRVDALWNQWNRLGTETRQILFPDARLRSELDNFFLLAKEMGKQANPSRTALVGLVSAQGTLGLLDVATLFKVSAAGGTLSAALNSPHVARLLTEGLQLSQRSPRAAGWARDLRRALAQVPGRVGPVAAVQEQER